MQYDAFTDEERRTLLLVKCYEDARRESGQIGYSAFGKNEEDVRKKPAFKQFQTVVVWLMSKGWGVTWKEINWIGYVKFVFAHMKPSIPFPGQLRNEMLLRVYLGSTTVAENVEVERTPEDLERIYSKVVDERIKKDPKAMMALGVRRV